jgi:hypothetical protein
MGRERQGGGVWTAPLEEKGGGGGAGTSCIAGVQTHLETHAPLREAHQRP